MCSTCGQKAARLSAPGGTIQNAIVFGEPVDDIPRAVTFLADYKDWKKGDYKFVTGSLVDQLITDEIVSPGYPHRRKSHTPRAVKPEKYYVKLGPQRWVPFPNHQAAMRYAKTTNGVVQSRDEVLAEWKATGGK